MIGAARADPANPRRARQLDRELGGIGHYQVTHALIAVDQRGGGGALEHCDGGARIERAALELAHVAGQAKHAVRVLSGEVGLQHGVSDHVGILLRQSARAQGIFCHPLRRLDRHPRHSVHEVIGVRGVLEAGPHRPGHHRRDGHPAAVQLGVQRLAQEVDIGLGGGVAGVVGEGLEPGGRGEVDDRSVPTLDHPGQVARGEVDDGLHEQAELVELLLAAAVEKRAVDAVARAVHEHVHAAAAPLDLGRQLVARGGLCEVR